MKSCSQFNSNLSNRFLDYVAQIDWGILFSELFFTTQKRSELLRRESKVFKLEDVSDTIFLRLFCLLPKFGIRDAKAI